MRFKLFLQNIRSCTYCSDYLKLKPKPIVQLNPKAKLLVIAQAPGQKARTRGRPFDDASGDRLRQWLGIDREFFYDEDKLAFMPMGFCYPGKSNTGDLPPCQECAPIWHHQILLRLTHIQLTLLVGTYAHEYYLNKSSLNTTMTHWHNYLPNFLPLPHPSWHNNLWLKNNLWFESGLVPYLQKRVKEIFNIK